jgi:hypothetical protein
VRRHRWTPHAVPGTASRLRVGTVTRVARELIRGVLLASVECDGSRASTPCRRRVLPPRCARQQPCSDRPRRHRPAHFPGDPRPRRAPLRLEAPRALPNGKPLPPRRGDAATEPVRRHARSQRAVRTRVQLPPRPSRPCLRPAVLVQAHRIGGPVRTSARVRHPQPDPPWIRRPFGTVAMDVSACDQSDRFA